MATRTWIGGHAGDPNNWSDPANWDAGVPVAGDDVIIASGASQPVLGVGKPTLKSLTINAAASLSVGSFALVVTRGITLSGTGSTIFVAGGSISCGDNLTLAAGSVLSGYGTVGSTGHKVAGTGTITAIGGTLTVTSTVDTGVVLTIGSTAHSDLLIQTVKGVSAIAIGDANQTLEVGANGTLTITSAESITAGTIKMDGNLASLKDAFGITLGTGSKLIGSGQVTTGTGAAGLSGTGIVEADGGTLDLVRNITSTSLQFEISDNAASVLQLDGKVAAGNTFTFLGSAGELAVGQPATFTETVVGLHAGPGVTPTNFIDFLGGAGVTVTSGGAGSGSSGSVTLSDGAVLNLTGITSATGSWVVDTKVDAAGTGTDIFLSAVCFAAGTRILTKTGERAVETLQEGDFVLTLGGDDLIAQPVKWIGRREINIAAHPRPTTVAPIRVQRGAFTDNAPHADLLVSPDHAIFVDGKLICARQLINGTTIRQERDWTSVAYFHVELDAHAILIANGLPTESYLDTGNRVFFANAGVPVLLHPDLTDNSHAPVREMASCAPFVCDEANVKPVWQRLADRAAAIGQPAADIETTTRADLNVVAAGRSVRPVQAAGGVHVFVLPKDATEVRMVSRAGSPTDTRPWLEDRRRLGVRVSRLVLRCADMVLDLALDHPDLAAGWWDVERDGLAMRRWTNGDAVVPLPVFTGSAMLEVHLSGEMTYVVSVATTAHETERRVA